MPMPKANHAMKLSVAPRIRLLNDSSLPILIALANDGQ